MSYEIAGTAYLEGGIVFPLLTRGITDSVQHLSNPWMLFQGVAQALCDDKELTHIAIIGIEWVLCERCLAKVKELPRV